WLQEALSLSELEHHSQPAIDSFAQPRRQLAYPLGQRAAIDRDDLRHVGNRILRQPGLTLRYDDVARRVGQAKIRRQDHAYDRLNSAAIECVCLHDRHRATKARLRGVRVVQISPPYLAALHYQSLRLRTRLCARRTGSSTPVASFA